MKETELLGKLMPGHPDIFPIIQKIREKYQIPPVGPEDDITEILLTRDDVDWDVVQQEFRLYISFSFSSLATSPRVIFLFKYSGHALVRLCRPPARTA